MEDNAMDQELIATEQAIEISFEKVLEAYSGIGYPPELIQQWTIPERDARTLINAAKEINPKHILEIGTFVGVTTQMLALYTCEDAAIHTIDPNFPLSVEMAAMKSELYKADTNIKTQDLALKASQHLKIDHKIHFHAGGFSKGSTFASVSSSSTLKVPIVGPNICEDYGPFDFIFIDGLHYSDAVLSDLNLAVKYLAPHGIIAIHDVIGRWGSNVRCAVFEFLDKRDDFIFLHDNYSKLYSSIGFLKHAAHKKMPDLGNLQLFDDKGNNNSLFRGELISNLASILFNMFLPKSVIQFGCGRGELLHILKKYGVIEVCGVQKEIEDGCDTLIPIEHHDFKKKYIPPKRYDLCICLGLIDKLEPDCVDSLIQSCIDSSDTIIFSCTPPGETGSSFMHRKPITYWVEKFFKNGYFFHDAIRPYLEPLFYVPSPVCNLNSSLELNIYVVAKQNLSLNTSIDSHVLILNLLKEKEGRIEDLVLQNFSQSLLTKQHQHEEQLLKEENQQLKQQYKEILISETYIMAKKIQNSFLMKVWRLFHKNQ